MDIDMSLLDNNNKFNGNSNSRTVRDAIRERHRVNLYSNCGGSELSMASMLDDSFSNFITGRTLMLSETPRTITALPAPVATAPVGVTPRYISSTAAASNPIPTPRVATLDTSVKPITVQEVKTAVAAATNAATNAASTTSSSPSSSTAPIVMSGGGGGGGSAPAPEENIESSARVAEEKKYLGLTKKQGLIALGVIAVGTLAYFKFVKKAF